MNHSASSEAAKAIVRRNTDDVQTNDNCDLFAQLVADDFVDHAPQPGTTPDKDGVRVLYYCLRAGFPDFRADIQWQVAYDNLVTTYKICHGTQTGPFLGIAATGRTVEFEMVDVMRAVDGRIIEHWGVANLLKMMTQLGDFTI